MPQLDELAKFFDQLFDVDDLPDDAGGIYLPSTRTVTRLGLALEPWQGLRTWADAECLDAIFLHRPWRLDPGTLGPGLGVIAYHRAFDERMTLGFNPHLAVALGISMPEVLGMKAGRPIGMLGPIPAQGFAAYCQRLESAFGGLDKTRQGRRGEVVNVAVVGAMTDLLVREAAYRHADVYVTGQWRQPAEDAVVATGMNVIVVGHRRGEEWGLRMLAELIREHWRDLRVILPPRE